MSQFLFTNKYTFYYIYKMLKFTLKYIRSYMFRSIWTILREPTLSLAKVTLL